MILPGGHHSVCVVASPSPSPPAGVVAHVARAAAGQQPPAQDGAEGLALDDRARVGGDVGSGGVGLLGGQAAELDREVDAVARGPDAVDAGDAPVGVDA